jgi:hypothetical protein
MTTQHDKAKRWQYGLGTLVVVTTGCAVVFAMTKKFGLLAVACLCIQPGIILGLLVVWAEYRAKRS